MTEQPTPTDADIATAALALLAEATLNISGKNLGTTVAVHNWLESIRTGAHTIGVPPEPDMFQHHPNGQAPS